MSSASNIIVVELPVATGFILAGMGFIYRQMQAKLATLTDHMTRSQVQDAINDRDMSEIKRQVPQLKESLAVVASELDSHLRWHERQPYRTATGT